MKDEDIAQILEVDQQYLGKLHERVHCGTSELHFNASSDYIVEQPSAAAITMMLRSQKEKEPASKSTWRGGSADAERVLGSCTLSCSELMKESTIHRTLDLH